MSKSEQRIRKPDSDLESYLANNRDIYTLGDIANIHAEVPGHNDEDKWFWIVELTNPIVGAHFVLTEAWCDFTGWDCVSEGSSQIATSAEKAALFAPEFEDYTRRRIRENLLAQLHGEQPFGIECVPTQEA